MAKENLYRLAVFYGACVFLNVEKKVIDMIESLINIYVRECKFDNYMEIIKKIEAQDNKQRLLPTLNSVYFAIMDFCEMNLEFVTGEKVNIMIELLDYVCDNAEFKSKDAEYGDNFNIFIKNLVKGQ